MQADADLLHAWREGDRAAGSELFRRHFASVQRFFRNTVEPEAIEDLVQSTFVACVEGRDRFEGRSSFRTYLFGVAHNLLRSHCRRRRADPLGPDSGLSSVADLGLGPATVLGRKREQRILIEALRRIPLDSQIVLQLRYWEQLRTAELAEVLGIPRGTAVDRLRRAQAQLERAIARVELGAQQLDSGSQQSLADWAAALGRRSGDRNPQLAALLPRQLGGRPLVARTQQAGLERARYRGGNAEVELRLRSNPDDLDEPRSEWACVEVGTRQGWLRWTTTPTRTAEIHVRVGSVSVELRLQPAASPTAVIELILELDLDRLAELEALDSER